MQLPAMSIPGVGIDLVATTCGQRASAGPNGRVVASGLEVASIWVVASIRGSINATCDYFVWVVVVAVEAIVTRYWII